MCSAPTGLPKDLRVVMWSLLTSPEAQRALKWANTRIYLSSIIHCLKARVGFACLVSVNCCHSVFFVLSNTFF